MNLNYCCIKILLELNQMDQKDKIFKAQAIPFILINEKQQQGKVTYQFQLQKQAADIITALKNKKVAIATVAGPQRSGKSFLSNRLLKRMSGFAIGPSTMPCTKGLWIWGEPIPINQDTVLIIMDTEGLNSVQRDINVDLKIFSLSILLSSVFIYNSLGHIDEKALENMSYVLRISENIRMKSSENQGDSEISKCFPYFYWVLRDFSLDLKGMTENQYLQNALKPISSDEKDPKNQIRSKIRKLFTYRRCECFPRPINDENKLAHIEQLNFDDLRDKFKDKMKQFQKTFFETLPVKLISGKPLTADIYLNLIRQYIGSMNSGKVPQVLTSLQRVIQCEARQVTEGLFNSYKDGMKKITEAVDEEIILRNHLQFKGKIENKINQKLKNWIDVGRTKQYKLRLFDALEKDYRQRIKANWNACDKGCTKEYSTLFQTFYNLPEMKSIDLVSDSYFKEKKNQFIKQVHTFLQNCKAPRKYQYIIQKVPRMLDYFQLLLARAKGIFNNQINKLTAAGRNQQAELESLNRMMKCQEDLLAQRQKELVALTHEKDILRRQYEKNEKMKEFEKETEKQGKSELKKTLQSYKEQNIELENQNKQLEQMVQKLKAQLNNKKTQISQMVKKTSSQPSESADTATSLPNQLVSSLTSLKERLALMKDFYDKNTNDQSLEESMMRQIEDERTEKHSEIQKIKEKYANKIAELRKAYNKNQAEQERNIKLINAHLDDLKTQNMDLQKEVSQNSDKKGNNFASERKNLQESLRLKQNNINSLKNLNTEKDKKINDLQFKLASINAQKATLQSYKETFPFILSETLAWVQKKNNKLKHSIKTLSNQDEALIRRIFKDADLNPF